MPRASIRPRAQAAPRPATVPGENLQAFERLLADISARFVNLPVDCVDDAITDALRQFVLLLDVDRSQLIRFSATDGEALVAHSWAVEGVPSVRPQLITSRFPWAMARVRAGHAVVAARIEDLPAEAATDKAAWLQLGVRSHLGAPLTVGGHVIGALAFGCLRRARDWPSALVERVGVLSDVFANALAHKAALEERDAAIAFERTLSGLLAALLTTPAQSRDSVIEAGLRDAAHALDAQRATLWQRLGETSTFHKTHRWLSEEAPWGTGTFGPVELPWICSRLVAGTEVMLASLSELPAEAAQDRETLRSMDMASAVFLPLSVAGAVIGALSFATGEAARQWPGPLVARARLMGEVFAALMARQQAERREAEAQAQAAHAARVGTMGLFGASLVHELTQPLAASLANAENAAELLSSNAPDLAELRATIADIVADDRRAGELIQQLRRFLRRGEVCRAEVDVVEVVSEAMRMAANQAADMGVSVVRDLPPSLPRIVGDRVQLQQVVLNLLLNALDATADSGNQSRQVTVAAFASPTGIGIEVADTGRGMDEPTRSRVFEPFFTTKDGGMGLGLAIARTIVTSHGGTIAVESAPGRGTAFRIELPASSAVEAVPAAAAATPSGDGGTVFVVDDEDSMRRAVTRHLRRAGYEVRSFATAQEYLDRATAVEGRVCLVSDVSMPGMSGLELQAELARRQRDLPTVFISGHGTAAATVQAMKAGAVTYLAKPFSKDELLAAVREALERSTRLDDERRHRTALRKRYASLTPREREVFALVAAGRLNKVIAGRLGAAEATIKIHRGRVMEKMGAESVADLVRMAGLLDPQAAPTPSP